MFIGFSWLRFLSRLAKDGLGIVTFGGTLSHLSPYTFKQVVRGTLWVRPIGGALRARPAGIIRNAAGTSEPFGACRYVGQPIMAAAGFQPALTSRYVGFR